MRKFEAVDPKANFPETERKVNEYWDQDKTFEKTLENRKKAPIYSFYDGPPFATGTPHYGHLVANTMKDVVPRYWTMRGYYVERKWGWDCHGLPIENIAEKDLKVKRKKQIEEEIGVEKFNEYCRSKVLTYVKEWERVIRRLGRWADMKNAYKTMDLEYMESVWWVFKELWDKGLIYEGYRSMHICPRCETTLSQMEVSEGYKDIKDISVIAKFELTDEPNTFVLAWTTTPWTLIANVALAIGEKIKYQKIQMTKGPHKGETYIIAKERANDALAKYLSASVEEKEKEVKLSDYAVVSEISAKELIGKSYKPVFGYYEKDQKLKNRENGWKIYPASFVTTEEGTGVVHIAPAFGEDDMKLGEKCNLPFVQHVGMDGRIKKEAKDFAGLDVKAKDEHQTTDIEVLKYLTKKNLIFAKEKFEHSYPHCWRCDSPLLNYATSSWFVNITKIKPEMLHLAKNLSWTPKYIKDGRFGNWLEGARDWSISRQRYWASVIPVWECKCGEKKVFGSVKDLEKASGGKITDLHKHVVDKIKIPCEKCKGEMKRVPDVLDTWFDSGSMPYAEMHYPFENDKKFQESFPADFIAEGIDQTRAWFYYLHVIATAIKDKAAFKNVIVNGIVLAEGGKKMSKKLQNYPDPTAIFDKYGADILRYYLMSSPVVMAENLNFKESELSEIQRGLFRMLWSSYSFFVLYANIDGWQNNSKSKVNPPAGRAGSEKSENLLDKWIVSELNILIQEVNKGMESYQLAKTSRLFQRFIDDMSNWYIRRSRKRFWKSENDSDKENAYQTLYDVLTTLVKLMAPFTPFVAEEIYRNLTGEKSVHLTDYPQADKNLIDRELAEKMEAVRKIVEAGLSERNESSIRVRQPLQLLSYGGMKLDSELESIIAEEANVKEVSFESKLKTAIVLDTKITDRLKLEGLAREIVRQVQSMRKKAGFNVEDRINLYWDTSDKLLQSVFEQEGKYIAKETLAKEVTLGDIQKADYSEEAKIEGSEIKLGVKKIQ